MFAEVFSSVGVRVIAVEPNPDCIRHIELSHGTAKVLILQAAAGPRNGLAVLNISRKDNNSSVSKDWIAAMEREHSNYVGLWSKQITVPMLTLDTLIDHYGAPNFIKIDVEGFEEGVLDGLSTQPDLLSFEFNSLYLDAALRCLDKNVFHEKSVFNFAMWDPVRLELPQWVGKEQLKEHLLTIEKGENFGDVFVKPNARCTNAY
jgi:FkbM family methyltransferase